MGQLKTQITDLERFIEFLQGEATSPGPLGKERCTCSVHGSSKGKVFNITGLLQARRVPCYS